MSNRNILLNAIGQQDDYLTKKPETTHLKTTWNTHTNFSKNLIKIYPTSILGDNPIYNFGETIIFDIEKPSDLLTNINLELIVDGDDWYHQSNTCNTPTIVPETMYALIDNIQILCGDNVLQTLTGHWLYIWDQLYNPTCKGKENIANSAYASTHNQTCKSPKLTNTQHILHLNIPFWFTQNPGLGLPLWALQNERIFIKLKLRNFSEISNSDRIEKNVVRDIKLIAEIVELDVDEKSKFKNVPLEYLIEQVEFNGIVEIPGNTSNRLKIPLQQYPFVNELIWVFTGSEWSVGDGDTHLIAHNPTSPCLKNIFLPVTYFNFWPQFNVNPDCALVQKDHTSETTILLNGNPINPKLKASYYRKIQRFQNHSTNTVYTPTLETNDLVGLYNCIYTYSFSLDPEKIKPSGFLSTEKFNNVNLDLKIISQPHKRNLHIFQKHFNIIRIKDGYLNILNN